MQPLTSKPQRSHYHLLSTPAGMVLYSFLVAWAPVLLGQAPDLEPPATGDATTTSTDTTNVVAVEVPVRVLVDGNPVRGLTRESFELFDGRQQREITGFEAVDLSRLATPAVPSNLSADDLTTSEPKVEMPLSARRHFLLLFDLSYAQPSSITRARDAVLELVTHGFHPTDLVAVATYSSAGGVRLLHGFTSDRKQVTLAVETLGLPQLIRPEPDPLGLIFGDLVDAGSSVGGGVGGVAFAEALQDFSRSIDEGNRRRDQEQIEDLTRSFGELANLLDGAPGRKHIIYLSEGFDTSALFGTADRATQIRMNRAAETGRIWEIDSEERFGTSRGQNQLEDMLEAFRRADCTFETVDIGGLRPSGGVDQGNRRAVERDRAGRSGRSDSLALIAAATGGELIQNFNNLSTALGEVLERTGVTYLLSFQPPDLIPDGSYHRLEVKLENGPKGAVVVHRPGYFAPLPFDVTSPEMRRLQGAAHLLDGDRSGEISTSTLAVAALPSEPGGLAPPTPLLLEISGVDLAQGRTEGDLQVEVFAYAIDSAGTVRDHLYRSLRLDLSRTGSRLLASGLKLYTHLDLPPGVFDLRTLVRDETGRWGVSTTTLWIPDLTAPGLLPPLMVEAPGRWLLVRDEQDPNSQPTPQAFVARGRPFLPTASPRLASGQPAAIAVTGFGFTGPPDDLHTEIRNRRGGLAEGASLRLVDRSFESGGIVRLAFTLETPGLASGSYDLKITATDPGGHPAQSTSRFEIVPDS